MRGNDLSNKVSPRHVIVFEGGLATLPLEREKDFQKSCKRRRLWEAISYWQWNHLMLAQIERIVRNMDVNIEVCTWMTEDMAFAIGEELDKMNIPVRSVWASSPFKLAQDLAYLPDIAAIYDPDPEHVLTYGRRGVYLTNPSQIGRGNG